MDNSLLAVRDINHKYIVVESICMTKQEAVVVETYTGICMLTGDD
jgi:hypothetical protein